MDLKQALSELNKQYGKNTVMILGETTPDKVGCISTGSLLIDQILGGGIAKGRIAEIYGDYSSGKTTLALQIAAQCQKLGRDVVYLDQEQAVDLEYARKLGVNTDNLIFSQPDSAEKCLDIAAKFMEVPSVGLIIVDSIGALSPQAEIDGEIGDVTIGLVARLLSKFCRKIAPALNKNDTALVCINQIRDKISTGWSAGPTTDTTGGRALKFFTSQRIELKKTGQIKEKDEVIGNTVKIKTAKNKITAPMKTVELSMIYGKGFNAENEVFDIALDSNLCQQSGAWFTSHDGKRMQGKVNLMEYYRENPVAYEELKSKVIAIINGELIRADDSLVDPNTGEILNVKEVE